MNSTPRSLNESKEQMLQRHLQLGLPVLPAVSAPAVAAQPQPSAVARKAVRFACTAGPRRPSCSFANWFGSARPTHRSSGLAYGPPLTSNVGLRACAAPCMLPSAAPASSRAARPSARSARVVRRARMLFAAVTSLWRRSVAFTVFKAEVGCSRSSRRKLPFAVRNHVSPTRRSSGQPPGYRRLPLSSTLGRSCPRRSASSSSVASSGSARGRCWSRGSVLSSRVVVSVLAVALWPRGSCWARAVQRRIGALGSLGNARGASSGAPFDGRCLR